MLTPTKQISAFVLAGTLLAAWPGPASAQSQEPTFFLNAAIGAQSHTHSFGTTGSTSVYGESATFASAQGVSGGLLFDVGAAYLVLPMVAIGGSFSTVSDIERATLTASVPHPIFFDQPATVSGEQGNLRHRETGIHIQAKVIIPTGAWLPTGSWLALVVGPSFFNLTQDLISGISIPAGTQTVVPVVSEESGSGVGMNGGIEGRFPVAPRVGIGGFLRYAGGNVDLGSLTDAKVGGFQAGVGVSLGF